MTTDPRFIASAFDPDDLVEIRLIPKGESLFAKASRVADLDARLVQANKKGKGVFIGANPRRRKGRKARDVLLARCLFADLDDVPIEEARRRGGEAGLPKPTCTISSGHGAHLWYRLREPILELTQWTAAQKTLIGRLDADPVVHDPPRLMRLPGFRNPTPPAARCAVVECDPARRHHLHEIIGSVAEPQRHRSHFSAVSAISATPDQVIDATLPDGERQRNACLHRLARGLKFDAGLAGHSARQVKPIVRQWHDRALPRIRTKSFDVSWSDFLRAWETAALPLFADPVTDCLQRAVQQAAEGDLPQCALAYDSMVVRRLIGLCGNLAALRADGRFFLSSHDAASRFDEQPAQVWRFLKMLCADGVIAEVEPGNARRATRYRWIGGEDLDSASIPDVVSSDYGLQAEDHRGTGTARDDAAGTVGPDGGVAASDQ
ncbi:MAG: DNA-primase RepB domain-containing protein [Phycisphaerales bacterium]